MVAPSRQRGPTPEPVFCALSAAVVSALFPLDREEDVRSLFARPPFWVGALGYEALNKACRSLSLDAVRNPIGGALLTLGTALAAQALEVGLPTGAKQVEKFYSEGEFGLPRLLQSLESSYSGAHWRSVWSYESLVNFGTVQAPRRALFFRSDGAKMYELPLPVLAYKIEGRDGRYRGVVEETGHPSGLSLVPSHGGQVFVVGSPSSQWWGEVHSASSLELSRVPLKLMTFGDMEAWRQEFHALSQFSGSPRGNGPHSLLVLPTLRRRLLQGFFGSGSEARHRPLRWSSLGAEHVEVDGSCFRFVLASDRSILSIEFDLTAFNGRGVVVPKVRVDDLAARIGATG